MTTLDNVEAPITTKGVHVCPGLLGGVEWNGPALHPGLGLLYIPAVDWCSTFTTVEEFRFIPGKLYMGGTVEMDETRQGWITAVDAASGEVRWRYRSALPMVAAVTPTAGGVLLTGELGGDFLVLDAKSGAELYRFNTGGPIGAGVVTLRGGGSPVRRGGVGQAVARLGARGSRRAYDLRVRAAGVVGADLRVYSSG